MQIGERVRSQQGRYSQIFVADSPEYAGLHVAAFAGVHPREFQRTRVVATDAFGWDYIRAVGKYRFISPAEVSAAMRAGCTSGERNLLVARDLPRGTAPYDSVQWHDEKYYFIDAASACAHSPRIGSVR